MTDAANTAPPAASNEQRETPQQAYWRQDLRIKRIQLGVSIGGFTLVIAGLLFNFWQSSRVALATRANVGHSVITHVTDLDKVFMANPALMPYFYGGKPVDEKDKDEFAKVSATAVMVLDVFDLVVTQNAHFPDYWDAPRAWDDWMIDVFSTSPILCKTLDEHPGWYGDRMHEMRKQGAVKWAARQMRASGS